MKKILIAISAIAFSAVQMSAQNFGKTDYAIQQGEYAKAITLLEEIVQNPKTTKHAEAYRKLGETHARVQQVRHNARQEGPREA